MANYIEPDFKLLMLIHEMFTFSDGDKKNKPKKKTKTQNTGIVSKTV